MYSPLTLARVCLGNRAASCPITSCLLSWRVMASDTSVEVTTCHNAPHASPPALWRWSRATTLSPASSAEPQPTRGLRFTPLSAGLFVPRRVSLPGLLQQTPGSGGLPWFQGPQSKTSAAGLRSRCLQGCLLQRPREILFPASSCF